MIVSLHRFARNGRPPWRLARIYCAHVSQRQRDIDQARAQALRRDLQGELGDTSGIL
jgi:hypothetical protein